jgi:hypothetical protein
MFGISVVYDGEDVKALTKLDERITLQSTSPLAVG